MRRLNVLVLLGRMRQDWPQPLAYFLADGQLIIETVANVHEAAVSLVAERQREGRIVRGLLVDPAVLAKRDVESLGVVLRRMAVPILLLPVGDVSAEQAREREAVGYGALCWKDAAAALPSLLTEKIKSEPDNCAHVNGSTSAAHESAVKTVTVHVPIRYDKLEPERLVSDAELQALLGI